MKRKMFLALILSLTLRLTLIAPAFAMNECVFTTPGAHNVISGRGDYYTAIDAGNSLWGCVSVDVENGGHSSYQSFLMRVAVDVTSVSISDSHTAVVTTDGSLWTTGRYGGSVSGDSSQGENDSVSTQDSLIKVMDDVVSVSCGNGHIAAVKTDGSLWMWGNNHYGQLGTGSSATTQDTPVKVMDNVVSVSCGDGHTAAVKTDGSLWTWGWGGQGQLGTGDYNVTYFIPQTVPVKVLDNVMAVCCGDYHTAAIKTDGSLWVWGNNNYGQLGIADRYRRTVNVPTKVLDGVAAVSCSKVTTAAIKTDGSLWLSGVNTVEEWQTGEGVWHNSYEELHTLTKAAEDIMAVYCCGEELIIAVKTDGSMVGYQDILSDLPDDFVVMFPDGSNKTRPVTPSTPSTPNGISVTVDSTAVTWTDAEPFIDANSRTMVPLRAVADAMGLDVNWDGSAREAVFTNGSKTIYFPIDSSTARTSNGGAVQMDTAAVIVNDRTYAPIRYLAEYFGYEVGWDAATRTVTIK